MRYPAPVNVLVLALGLSLVAHDASAWGTRAKKAIAMGALQIIRQEYPEAFVAGDTSYEADLLRGAEHGVTIYEGKYALENDAQTLEAVTNEIQMLRAAREYGVGSYFAYRMGALSALVSEVILPFGIPFNDEESALHEIVGADLDDHLRDYSYVPRTQKFKYVRAGETYFGSVRPFYPDDLEFLRMDYGKGDGYYGFLREAGRTYFERSVEATVDAWHTVLRPEGEETDIVPSQRIVTFYFVDEIGYLLLEKRSMHLADRVYRTFDRVNPDIWEAYQLVGDIFYEFNTPESRDRAVREWQIAQQSPGPQRRSSAIRLAKHYVDEGESLLRRAASPDATDNDLVDALRAFELALEYDGTNDIAANRISETTSAIADRQERYETQQRKITSALVMTEQAEKGRLDRDFGGSLTSYNSAVVLLEGVDSEFKDLQAVAKDHMNSAKKGVREVISEILDTASDRIEDGDTAMASRNYDEAIKFYSMVPNILGVIDAEEGSVNASRVQELVEQAHAAIEDAELQKKRQG